MKETVSERYAQIDVRDCYIMEVVNVVVGETLSGGVHRFGNHSCEPNAEYDAVRMDNDCYAIFAVASKFIPEGTGVTFNYRITYTERDVNCGFLCKCGSPRCAGTI